MMRIKFFIDQFLLRAATDKNHSSDYKNGKIIKNLLWYISLPEQIGGAFQQDNYIFNFSLSRIIAPNLSMAVYSKDETLKINF